MPSLKNSALLATVLLLATSKADDAVDCQGMRVKQLRTFLAQRGVKCEGCAEKSDFLSLCEEHKDTPVLPPKEPDPPPADDKNIDDLLKSMKGIPGMEGIKMFGADDLKNMNYEQMGNMFGGGQKPRKTRKQYRREVVDFYQRYGLTYTDEGVEKAMDKWKGREEKMFDALYKKYDVEIKAHWDKEDAKRAAADDAQEDAPYDAEREAADAEADAAAAAAFGKDKDEV